MEADIVNQIEGLRPVKGREGNYPYILFNKSSGNSAAWVPAAARPTPATSEPAALWCRHRFNPSRHARFPGKPPPKPLPSSMPSFPGCAVPKSVFPSTARGVGE